MKQLLYGLEAVLLALLIALIAAGLHASGDTVPWGGLAMLLVLGAFGLAVYFLPTYLAWNRRTNFTAIAVLNFVGGWTLVGWVVALVWALSDEEPTKTIVNQTPTAAVLCASRGKYSPTGSRFCPHCGAGFSVAPIAMAQKSAN